MAGLTHRQSEILKIARAHGAKVYVEPWKGFAQQKNSALDKASGAFVGQFTALGASTALSDVRGMFVVAGSGSSPAVSIRAR